VVGPADPPRPYWLTVSKLVRQSTDVSFILDHLGKPTIRDGKLEPWSTELAELTALPESGD
jgi:L-fuconolactonase